MALFQLVLQQFLFHLAHIHLLLATDRARPDEPEPRNGLTRGELKFPDHVERDQCSGSPKSRHAVNKNPALLLDNLKELDDLLVRRRRSVWKLEVVVVNHLVNKIASLVVRVVQSDDSCYFQLLAPLYYYFRRQWLRLVQDVLRVYWAGTGKQLTQQNFRDVSIFWLLIYLVLLPVKNILFEHRGCEGLHQSVAQILNGHSVRTRSGADVAKRHRLRANALYYIDDFLAVNLPEQNAVER